MEKREILRVIFKKIAKDFSPNVKHRWENTKLVSSIDRDFHNSRTHHAQYDGFLIDIETHAIVVSLSSVSLRMLYLERPLFAERIVNIVSASSDEQLERRLPAIEEWPYDLITINWSTEGGLRFTGENIVDCRVVTVSSELMGCVIKTSNHDGEIELEIPSKNINMDSPEELIGQITSFLSWIAKNPKNTTLGAKKAGTLQFLRACE